MKNTQSASATPGRLRRRLTSARLVLGLSAPLAFMMVLALATSVAAQDPAPTQTPAPAADTARQRSIDDVLAAAAPTQYDTPNDHESNKPGPPTLVCKCTSNPVVLMWAPNNRTVAQPELYRMYIGSRSGQADLGTFDLGLTTQYTAIAAPGGNYYVRIEAVNAFGGNYSNEQVISVPDGTTPVLSGTLSGRALTLYWTGSPTATLYVSNSATFAAGTFSAVAVSGNVVTYSNVAPGLYYFLLRTGTQWSNILPAIVW